jgi:hypothetical protein
VPSAQACAAHSAVGFAHRPAPDPLAFIHNKDKYKKKCNDRRILFQKYTVEVKESKIYPGLIPNHTLSKNNILNVHHSRRF